MATDHLEPPRPLDLGDPRVQALIRHRTRRVMNRRVAAIRTAGVAALAVPAPGIGLR